MSNNEETRVIEINGIKMEVDLRHAKRVDMFTIGTKVKLLVKGGSYSSDKVHSGVVVGFEPFEDLPTIVVCYLESSYDPELKFAYINKDTQENYDVIPAIDDDLPIQKSDVLAKIDGKILKAQEEIKDLERKRDYFLSHFNQYFKPEEVS